MAKKENDSQDKSQNAQSDTSSAEEKDLPGYPIYPESEDIYNQAHKEGHIDPENISIREGDAMNVSDSTDEEIIVDDTIGSDLDVPGSDLDDVQESIGSEDEENNYYSLGGDNHED